MDRARRGQWHWGMGVAKGGVGVGGGCFCGELHSLDIPLIAC